MVEPVPDILQRTLGKQGVSHNHLRVFRDVFLRASELPNPLSGGENASSGAYGESGHKCTDAEIPQPGKGNLGIGGWWDQPTGSVLAFHEGRRASYAAMSSSWLSVIPMSSSPSSRRQRV